MDFKLTKFSKFPQSLVRDSLVKGSHLISIKGFIDFTSQY